MLYDYTFEIGHNFNYYCEGNNQRNVLQDIEKFSPNIKKRGKNLRTSKFLNMNVRFNNGNKEKT
jgi:hypothetical protein